MLQGITTALIFVNDIRSSRDWYRKFLSLEPVEDLPNFVSFQIGSAHLNLHLADALSPLSTGGTVVYWKVDDVQKTISKATELGASIYRGPLFVQETSKTIAQVMDPFGNVFGIES